jgi:hypothetical protein
VAQLDPGISRRELPDNLDLLRVTPLFPGLHFINQNTFLGNAVVGTLPSQNAQFDFSHVQPTAMFSITFDCTLTIA